MSGEMIKGLTPEMLHHANLTGAHGDAISGGVARMGGVTDMLTGSFGGEAGALNVTGSDAWVQGTNHKSVTAIGLRRDAITQGGNLYEGLGQDMQHGLGSIVMPTE
jgi:hypothetical protein